MSRRLSVKVLLSDTFLYISPSQAWKELVQLLPWNGASNLRRVSVLVNKVPSWVLLFIEIHSPGGSVLAILQIGPRLQQWSRDSESNVVANSMFGLVVGEDRLFANAILLRLADAFVIGDKETRFSIVRVFLSELKHHYKTKNKHYDRLLSKARVPNHSELLKRVKSVFDSGDEESRGLALVLFGCWAELASDNAQIQYLILSSLVSHHAWLVKASLFAAGCFCEISDDFACTMLEMLINMVTSSEISLPIKLDATRVFGKFRCSYSVANKAYKTGLELLLNSTDEEFLVAMFFSLSKLASVSTLLIPQQVGLLLSFLNRGKNLHVQEAALRCLKFLVTKRLCHNTVNSDLIHGLFCMLEEPEVSLTMQCEALQVLHKVLLCIPSSAYMELREFVKLFTIAENAIQHADLIKSHLAIHILVDLSCRFVGGCGAEYGTFCSSSLPSRVISLIKDQIKLLVTPLLRACPNYSKLFQYLQSLLKIFSSIVRRHPYLGVLVLDNINSVIECLVTIGTTGQAAPSIYVAVKFDREKNTAVLSKLFRKIYRFLVACLENLNKVGAIDTEVLSRVQILVELVSQCSLFDCYTYIMYCLLLHSRHIWGGMVHQDDRTHNNYNLSIFPHSCHVKCKIDTLEFVSRILTETDNWTAYRVAAYAACQGEWLFSAAVFSKLIQKVKSDSCSNWLKALFQYTQSEGVIQLLRLPKQGSNLVEWLENNNFPLNYRDYFDEKDPRDTGNINNNHYSDKLAAAQGALCSSMAALEAAVTSSQSFCFQRWFLSLRARALKNVVVMLKIVRVLLDIDWCNQVEVERNVMLGCLKSFDDISQIAFQYLRLAEEFDLIGKSFIEMDSESSAIIAALALSCSLLAFVSGFAVFVKHQHSHGNLAVDKNSCNSLLALSFQDLVVRLWHVDHETSTKIYSLFDFIDQSMNCFHLQPRCQTCNIGFEYIEFLNVCSDAVSGVVQLQDEITKEHNQKTPSEVTKNGLLLMLDTITKWVYFPSRIPKFFFKVRQVVGSELFVHNEETKTGVGMSIPPSSNLSLNLCLQLKNLPLDLHVRPKMLYCILYCQASCQVPTPGGQAPEQKSSGYEAWEDNEIVELNKKLFHRVTDSMANNVRSGKRGRYDGNNRAVEAFVQFVPNQKGQGFSSCLLDVSDFAVGSYRIKWHSCLVDSRGSYWSLLPLNMGPVFTIHNSMDGYADFDNEICSFQQKALEAAMNDINNSFGKGSVTRLGSAGGALVETFPSGCLTLDCALGGGLPKGRIVEIYGPESSGKTTLALHAIAEVQKLGGNAMLVDAEHAFDPAYSKALGVDVENLIVCQPDHGEMGLEIADRMCRSGAIDLICVDSVSALTPRAEIEGEIGMQQMGLQARLMSQALRKMSANASKAGCTLIFLNQIRYKIGVYYGNPEVTSGGIALKFFASLRLEIRPTGKIKSAKGDEEIGLRVRVRVQKSKVSRPYKQAEFEIIFGEGVSTLGCILDCAELLDVVSKKGSWYSYGDNRLGQGRDKAMQYLKENPHLLEEVEKVVRSSLIDGTGQAGFASIRNMPLPREDEIIFEETQ